MKRFVRAMNCCAMLLLAAAAAFAPAQAASRKDKALAELKAQLMGHIVELASDAYGGREPGTDGESMTLRYIGKQLFDIGLVSGTNDPGHAWFAPVTLIGREPDSSRAVFSRKGKRVFVLQDQVLVLTSGKRALVENAPLVFVGNGSTTLEGAEEGRNADMGTGLGDGVGPGGKDSGIVLESTCGCSASPGSSGLGVLVLAGLALRRRRKA